jgi:hypothetical protein
MSTLESDMTLPVGAARAVRVCRAAGQALGWSVVVDEEDVLAVQEDPTRLECCASPARVEMRFAASGDDETRLKLITEVPGYGPIASRQVRDRSRAVALGIARRVTGRERPSDYGGSAGS